MNTFLYFKRFKKVSNLIKICAPAKINLYLKVLNKRDDGFHNIESVMQTINLFDYLTFCVENFYENKIILSGNSNDIPYNQDNLVFKAAKLFIETCGISNKKIDIRIEKNIPVSAGLAGGSSDAAGTIYGLNKIFDNPLSNNNLHELCSKLGSDLNVCLEGGKILATGRGEIIEKLDFEEFNLSIIKPINLGISAKDAYTKYSHKIQTSYNDIKNFKNHLEWAIIDNYPQLKYIKQKYPKSIMTGSGSAYFSINETFTPEKDYLVINNLKAINHGICECI